MKTDRDSFQSYLIHLAGVSLSRKKHRIFGGGTFTGHGVEASVHHMSSSTQGAGGAGCWAVQPQL